jgi:hypothetical protein
VYNSTYITKNRLGIYYFQYSYTEHEISQFGSSLKRKLIRKSLKTRIKNEHRSARRYNIYIDNIIFNVSNGIFPGEYEKPRNPVKIEKKKPVYKVRKQHRGVPRSKYEDYKHRESDFDMYAKRRKRVKKSS